MRWAVDEGYDIHDHTGIEYHDFMRVINRMCLGDVFRSCVDIGPGSIRESKAG